MRIGYACLTVGVPNTSMRSCQQKNASDEQLGRLIAHNLDSLENIINYNITNGIRLFRISSDLIPFGSSPVNQIPWWGLYAARMDAIGEKIKDSGMRVSMHPGQYTVLNSPRPDVVSRAIDDLNYHTRVLEGLGLGPEHKIILHVGGVYDDREQSIRRFRDSYGRLDEKVRRRLVIENDDRSYPISEVLAIGRSAGIPVVYDNLHNRVNPGRDGSGNNDRTWIDECAVTWLSADGPQKIHYSQQDPGKQPGAHSSSIRIREFAEFYAGLAGCNIDIMLEVKDKNLSAVKCLNTMEAGRGRITALEREWSRYKYKVLEQSPLHYQQIREFLKIRPAGPALEFYELVESALAMETSPGHAVNAAEHVWGYFRQSATQAEQGKFRVLLEDLRQGRAAAPVKRHLWRLAQKYQQEYLLNSYYFVL